MYSLFTPAISELLLKACPSISYRLRKEILGENVSFSDFRKEILKDTRVRYVFTLSKDDGYIGDVFHGGWIPEEKRKYCTTGAESALRFLAEMGVAPEENIVKNGLDLLLKPGWNRGTGTAHCFLYRPEIGLPGEDYLRATVFAYYSLEDFDFTRTELERTMGYFEQINKINSWDEITGIYRNKRYYNTTVFLPWSYHIKLLAFTRGWRSPENTAKTIKAVSHLIELSPIPDILVKYRGQLVAPAQIFPRNLRKSLIEFNDKDWFPWFHTFELFARMGIVQNVPILKNQASELLELLHRGNGFFPVKPKDFHFHKWSVYSGLALEENWREERWKYDLTFRSLLILKYSGLLQ